MGTPDFAVASLAALVDAGCNVVAVVTAPDRPAGRGMKLQPSAVKQYAAYKGITVLQPTNLKSEVFLEELRSFRATLQVVVAFRMLPEAVWAMPTKGTFNLHASLLPHYRGAAPINHAIINGERETGVTTFFLQHQIDTGNIILQEKTPIGSDETAGELHDRLMSIGARLVVETARQIADGTVKAIPQTDCDKRKEAPKIFKEHCLIDWAAPAKRVHDLVRGMSPYPAAYTMVERNGEPHQLKIYRTVLVDGHGDPAGTISSDGRSYLEVSCGNGAVRLLEMQLPGKKRMGVNEFLNGQYPDSLRIIIEN